MEFKRQSADKCATWYDQNDSLIYRAAVCTCSALVRVFVDRFSSNEDCVSAARTRHPFSSQNAAVRSHFVVHQREKRGFQLDLFFFPLSLDNTLIVQRYIRASC